MSFPVAGTKFQRKKNTLIICSTPYDESLVQFYDKKLPEKFLSKDKDGFIY